MKRRKSDKRVAAAQEEYGRACVAWQRMSHAVDEHVTTLYYALQRKEQAKIRYTTAAKRLANIRGK